MLSRVLGVSVLAAVWVATPARAAVGPTLLSRLAKGESQISVVILLESNPASLHRAGTGHPSAAAETQVALQAESQATLDAFVTRAAQAGIPLFDARVFWLSPAVAARVDASDIAQLDALPGVAAVVEDAPVALLNPVREMAAHPAYDATAAGLDVVGVRSLWQRGITGKGTLVASLDTGVDGLHPALKSHYRGNHADSHASWRDSEGGNVPNDPAGHGTHTMGTVLGCEATDTVGIAPDAEWIAAGVVDRGRGFSETLSDLLGAFQWLADPDGNPDTHSDRPDVVLNSWGIPQGVLPSCDATFWQVVDHLEELGTVVVFAAGNEGPGPSTLRQPADRGDQYLSCFSVGAVDALDPLLGAAPFSSRGPSSCSSTLIKPELVAPGVNVRSCAPGGGYRILSGTSMAAPYVAGAVCLLRQYNPDATPLEIKEALVRSALDVGSPGPDFNSGYGLLNIPGAIALLQAPRPLSWRITAPALSQTAADSVGVFTKSINLQLENLGCSLRGMDVIIRSRNSSLSLLGETRFAYDYVPDELGSLMLPVSFRCESQPADGDRLWLELDIRSDSPVLDTTVSVGVKVGAGPRRAALAMKSGGLSVVATNVGRFDAEEAAAVSVQNPAFTFDDVVIPFSGGLEIHTRTSDPSTFGPDHDFEPAPDGQLLASSDGPLSDGRFRDTRHADAAGVEFEQRVYSGSDGPGAYLLMEYTWQRLWTGGTPLQMGSWFHWQPASGTTPIETGAQGELCMAGDGIYFGCVWLSDAQVERSLAAYDPTATQLPMFSAESTLPASESYWSRFREAWHTSGSGHFTLAFVAGHSLAEWQAAAGRARAQYSAGAGASEDPVLPSEMQLYPNFPNPFNPATTIRFALDRQTFVRLDIFNSLGRHVVTLVNSDRPAGLHEVHWQATDERGLPMPSGTYFIRVSAGDQVLTGKMSLVR